MTQVTDEQQTTNPVTQITTYEFPLNERIRTLLRLEDLFAKFGFFMSQDHRLDHHTALLTLFEIIEVGSRADLKSDLLQEPGPAARIAGSIQRTPRRRSQHARGNTGQH